MYVYISEPTARITQYAHTDSAVRGIHTTGTSRPVTSKQPLTASQLADRHEIAGTQLL